jgi:hypothetical protein
MEPKAGYKTTEFWIAILTKVAGMAAVLGVFSPEQADAITQAVTQLGGLIAMVGASFGYSLSRGNSKKT